MRATNKLSKIELAMSAAALCATASLSGCTTSGGKEQVAGTAQGHCMGVVLLP
ncbi:MAG: hypothetical protein ACREVE_00615 [Gammaproteobacteria bacterium]